jgi:hypothetical protein
MVGRPVDVSVTAREARRASQPLSRLITRLITTPILIE